MRLPHDAEICACPHRTGTPGGRVSPKSLQRHHSHCCQLLLRCVPARTQDGTQGGVFFNYCNYITATNGTFYYEFSQNPWYQATITGMANQGTVWNITVCNI